MAQCRLEKQAEERAKRKSFRLRLFVHTMWMTRGQGEISDGYSRNGGGPTSHIPALESPALAASFRT